MEYYHHHIKSVEDIQLPENFVLENVGTDKLTQNYYDTFDFLLFQNNFFLIDNSEEFHLVNPEKSDDFNYSVIRQPLFYNSFESNGKLLKSLIGARALLPAFSIQWNNKYYCIKNKDSKIIFRFILKEILNDEKKVEILALYPLKGYKKEAKTLISTWKSFLDKKISNIHHFLIANYCPAHTYSIQLNLEFDPHEPLELATKKIFSFYLDIIRKNINGIVADIDTEFLHDFRVGLRKSRSLMSLMKKELEPRILQDFKNPFKRIQQKTNYLRDIDVFLERIDYFKGLISIHQQAFLDNFFDHLKDERKKELQRLKRHFKTKFFHKTFKDWEELLIPSNSSLLLENKSSMPLKKYASESMSDLLKKFHKDVGKIQDHEIVDAVHDCRILCKQLRYVADIFKSLYPAKQINLFLRIIKNFQNILGQYNDAYMQRIMISSYLINITGEKHQEIKALQDLQEVLARIKGNKYQEFVDNYSSSNKQLRKISSILK